jgi:alkanesulfonate monooxygenase SsuD/methylene tetrahydromethanopterin reductase-like flavin-dependent oxidoreductase (luciferase family)
MKYGFVLPGGDAREQIEQAVIADQAGWDGVFVWESHYSVDPWTLLGAMSQRTTRVKLGTMLTPLPWRRPWKLAGQVVAVDQLSNGRVILAVGLGAFDDALGHTGEITDLRTRAEMLDEAIHLIDGLWTGRLRYQGRHYRVDFEARTDIPTSVAPVQQPRPPIWVVGVWPRPKSMERALRCDGLIPQTMDANGGRETTPDDIREIVSWLADRGRTLEGFDIIAQGETPTDGRSAAAEMVRAWSEAGCTWWLETRWGDLAISPDRMQDVRKRLEAGPPAIG